MDSSIVYGIQVLSVHDANKWLVISDDREVRSGKVQSAFLNRPLDGKQFQFNHGVIFLSVIEESRSASRKGVPVCQSLMVWVLHCLLRLLPVKG